MIKNTYFALAGLVLLQACGGSSDSEESSSERAISNTINQLNNQASESNLITLIELDNNSNRYVFTLEDGEQVFVDSDLVTATEDQPEQWQTSVSFTDSRTISLARLGTSFAIPPAAITLNPNGTTPLAASLTLNLPVANRIRVSVAGKEPEGVAINKEFSAFSRNFELPILGLYANYSNQVTVTLLDDEGNERLSTNIAIQTSTLTDDQGEEIPMSLDILQNNLSPQENHVYMVSSVKQAFDQFGEVRWAYTGEMSDIYRKLDNGNLIGSSSENSLIYHHEAVKIISMLGEEIVRLPVENLMHHDARFLPNGNLLVAGNTNSILHNGAPFIPNDLPEEDVVYEINVNTNQIVKTFDFNLLLDSSRIRPGGRPDDWLHLNSLYYDEATDALIISAQAQSSVVSVDYATGNLNWILSAHENWPDDLTPFLLSPVDENDNPLEPTISNFWTYGQHAAMTLPNGNLFLYDNGQYRDFYQDNTVPLQSYTRAIEYKIDAEQKTVSIAWQYQRDLELFTPITGDVDYDINTNRKLIAYMAGNGSDDVDIPRIIELDENDNVLFDVVIDRGSVYYRAEKFDLYEGIE